MSAFRYKVYFQPLVNADNNIYGAEVDVSDRVFLSGVGDIRSSIDASDYDIGVFVFSDLELKALNVNGYFNEADRRSIFITSRDRCKVRVEFQKDVFTRDINGTILSDAQTVTTTYRGLINDEATRIDIVNESIRFKVLSRDSVFRTTKISAGIVTDGTLASVAIFQILNVPRITSVLTVSEVNIDPDLDIAIDDGGFFDNREVKQALDKLLFATNSVLLVDDAGIVSVRGRGHDETRDVLNLYGQYDSLKRENIVSIEQYNPGRHRTFTSILINNTRATSNTYAAAFGLRTKKYTLEFITDPDKEQLIAERVLDEFKIMKAELEVTVPTYLLTDVQLLDRVSVNYPLRIEPVEGTFLPVFDITKFDDADQPFPLVFGSNEIDPRTGYKIIEISHNPERFVSKLKLRQFGTALDDGYYNTPFNNLFDFAVFGFAKFGPDGDPADTWNPSVIGAARFDLTDFI